MKTTKEKLLHSLMTELPLGESFIKNFKSNIKSKIPTVDEFIKLNKFIKYNSDRFKTFDSNNLLFTKKSKKWYMLKNFLLQNGFTTDDWIMLIPNKIESGELVEDFSILRKEQILDLPIRVVCPGKSTHGMDNYTVKDILELEIESHYPTYLVIQKKLKLLGFEEKDGEIMRLINKKSKEYYIKSLMERKKFSFKEANHAVDIGLKAGWIHL